MLRTLALLAVAASACADTEEATGPGEPWTTAPDLPGRRQGAAVTALGTRLAVVGGFTTSATEGAAITRDVLVFDTLADEWSELPAAPVAWTEAGLASSGGALYLLGGLDAAGASGDAYVLGPGSLEWRALASMPRHLARGAAAIVAAPPRIFVIGGANERGPVASVLSYSFLEDAWTELPDLPSPRSHGAAMRRFDGTLVVAGGLGDDGAALGDVLVLQPNAETWEVRAPMPTPRGGCAYGVALGHLVCAGGTSGPAVLANVESYDPVGDAWTMQPPMPAPRAGARGAVIGQQLYVAGGAAALAIEPTASLFVFSLLDTLR